MASLPYNIETNLTYRAILMARTAFTDVATGKRIMVLVSSDPGFGKTLEAKRALRLANAPFDETGSITTEQDFVRYMWNIESGIICHKGRKIRVLLVDDKDGLFRRGTIANHLKAGFGADRRRIQATSNEISLNEHYRNSENEEERKKYKAIIPAKSFDVHVGMIGLANIDYTDPDVVAGLPHFAALVSKGLDPQRIPNDAENGGRDVFTYTHYLATVQNSLGGEGYTYEVARAAVEFYVRNVHHLIDIPPRRLSMIAKVIKDNPDPAGREERLNAMLRATDQRPKLKIPEEWIPMLLWPSSPPSRPDRQPDRDPPPAASAPIPAAPKPDRDTPPAASAPTSVALDRPPTPDLPAEPPSRMAILQDVARMLRGRVTHAMITGTAERLQINGYDEDKRVFIAAEWPNQPAIQDEFLLQLLSTVETRELRKLLAGNGADLPKGHVPIREIKTTREKFKFTADIEWSLAVGQEAKANLIAAAHRTKVTRPWRGHCVPLHAVDGQLAFDRSPFKYDFGDLEWALSKNWTSLSVASSGAIKLIVPGLLGDYAVYLRGYDAGLPNEIERQGQMYDIAEHIDRENLGPIEDAFDNYWHDHMTAERTVPLDLGPVQSGEITMDSASSDAEMRYLTLQWGLKPFRGRAAPLDIVAYQRRCGFLKIAGPKLTRDQLVEVRKKPKGFWQEQGAAESWLAEIVHTG